MEEGSPPHPTPKPHKARVREHESVNFKKNWDRERRESTYVIYYSTYFILVLLAIVYVCYRFCMGKL